MLERHFTQEIKNYTNFIYLYDGHTWKNYEMRGKLIT